MPQKYLVSCAALGHELFTDGRLFTAVDHADAATQWARHEDVNSADYWIVGGEDALVTVTPVDDDLCKNSDSKQLRVMGESVPVYTAYPAGV